MTDATDGGRASSGTDGSAEPPSLGASIRAAGAVAWALIGLMIVAAVLAAGFAWTKSVTVPIVLAWVLAIVFQPGVDWLIKKGLSRGLAAALVLLGMILVIAGVIALVAGALVANWDEISSDLSEAAGEIDDWLANTPLSDTLGTDTKDSTESSGSTVLQGAAGGVASVFNSAFGIIAGVFLGLWIAFYVLQGGYVEERKEEGEEADSAPSERLAKFHELAHFARTSIRGYYVGQTVLGVLNGTVIGLAMVLLGVPGAVSVAIVNVFGSYIPYLGAFVGGALAVLLALADGGTSSALIMLVVVLLAQNTLQNVVEPRITAKYVHLSPLVILLAAALGAVVAGLLGLILAVPFTAVVFKAVEIARRPDALPPHASPAADDTS